MVMADDENSDFVANAAEQEVIREPPQIRSPAKEKSLPSKSAMALKAKRSENSPGRNGGKQISAGQVRRLERELKRADGLELYQRDLKNHKVRSMKSGIRIVNRNEPLKLTILVKLRPIFVTWSLMLASIARAGPPFVTDDPEVPPVGGWEINIPFTLQRTPGTTDIQAPLFDLNYGLPNIQLEFDVPVAVVKDNLGTAAPNW